ncbi:ATP-binding protein [Achromobacter sp. UMC46]|uniref:ATP-binding protein n=1 Tax=Achromobacter sp. UMC46 TaxID=1862319 RepID=UPI0016019532|nr:ATP-binding protein [Achromobacter sp. UMC46]MBB1596441.1 hybrid sensor histidine kinase/response regulator [Achromobacter sp. UMC46]
MPSFLAGGGEMGLRVADFDWASTPLGPITAWPGALRVATGMVMSSRFPCCLVWGRELITLYNDAFAPILGTKPDALGRPFSEIWHEAWPLIGPIAERAFAGEATFIEDYPLRIQRSGQAEDATFTFCYSPVRDEHGVVVGMMDTVIETTSRVNAERAQAEALRQAEDTLRQSQKMEAVGQLAGGLAHDFNNLLMGISGSLELLGMRLAQQRHNDLERHIDVAQSGARKAAALTHRLLAFSRRQPQDPKATDVNRLVAGMEDLIRRSIGPGITLDLACEPDLWPAWVDRHQLENALLNLCLNARDAIPGHGTLGIATRNVVLDAGQAQERGLAPGDYLVLRVTDTGCGMAPDTVQRIFEPFFTTKSAGQGTGLGLSMLYSFVRQSRGQVQVSSRPGEGTAMTLYFPRHQGAMAALEQAAFDAPPTAARGETILIAEDDAAVLAVAAESLKELGYAVAEAADGAAALRRLASPEPLDLLICDLGLPGGINGHQIADAARRLRPGMKVLIMTGSGLDGGDASALEPALPILPKPFALEDLARQVHALMRG